LRHRFHAAGHVSKEAVARAELRVDGGEEAPAAHVRLEAREAAPPPGRDLALEVRAVARVGGLRLCEINH